ACPRARALDPGIGGVEPVILLASLAVGLVAYLAVGLLTGYLPRAGTRVQVPRRGRIERQTWLLQAGTEPSVAQFVVGSLAAAAPGLQPVRAASPDGGGPGGPRRGEGPAFELDVGPGDRGAAARPRTGRPHRDGGAPRPCRGHEQGPEDDGGDRFGPARAEDQQPCRVRIAVVRARDALCLGRS